MFRLILTPGHLTVFLMSEANETDQKNKQTKTERNKNKTHSIFYLKKQVAFMVASAYLSNTLTVKVRKKKSCLAQNPILK